MMYGIICFLLLLFESFSFTCEKAFLFSSAQCGFLKKKMGIRSIYLEYFSATRYVLKLWGQQITYSEILWHARAPDMLLLDFFYEVLH